MFNLISSILPNNKVVWTTLLFMTTTHLKFFGVKPNCRILFLFGSIGAFCCVCEGIYHHTNFESQYILGIVLGHNKSITSIVCYNLTLDSFFTSADYPIGKNNNIGGWCHLYCQIDLTNLLSSQLVIVHIFKMERHIIL